MGAHRSAVGCDKSMGAAMKSDEMGTVGYSQFPFSDKTKVLEIFTLSFLRSLSHIHKFCNTVACVTNSFVFLAP